MRCSRIEQWTTNMKAHFDRNCCRYNYNSMSGDEANGVQKVRKSIKTVQFCKNDIDKFLLDSFWVTRGKTSKDPLDKVYSLLGLLSEGSDFYSISPDYSLPTLEVYTKVVETLIQRHADLDFLCNFRPGLPEFPSWVPDWSVSFLNQYSY